MIEGTLAGKSVNYSDFKDNVLSHIKNNGRSSGEYSLNPNFGSEEIFVYRKDGLISEHYNKQMEQDHKESLLILAYFDYQYCGMEVYHQKDKDQFLTDLRKNPICQAVEELLQAKLTTELTSNKDVVNSILYDLNKWQQFFYQVKKLFKDKLGIKSVEDPYKYKDRKRQENFKSFTEKVQAKAKKISKGIN
jgi:hypothetical protein